MDIDDYLTRGSSPEEERQRRDLAKYGPTLVEAIVYRTLVKLRSYRDGLEEVFAGPWAVMAAKQVFERAGDLIAEIINTTPQGGSVVAQNLLALMEHHDAGVRALATFFTNLAGIPLTLTTEPMRKRFLIDDDLLVKMAAAAFLQANEERFATLSPEEQKNTSLFVAVYAKLARQEPGSMRLRDDDATENARNFDANPMARLTYMLQVLNDIPQMIALQEVEY